MTDKVKACCKCGNKSRSFFLDGKANLYFIRCLSCRYQSKTCKTEDGAIAAWNERQGESDAD